MVQHHQRFRTWPTLGFWCPHWNTGRESREGLLGNQTSNRTWSHLLDWLEEWPPRNETVWRILTKLLTNALAMKMNWRGANGKQAFERLALKGIVPGLSAESTKASDGEIEKYIKRWKQLTSDRDVGKKKRAQPKTEEDQRREDDQSGVEEWCHHTLPYTDNNRERCHHTKTNFAKWGWLFVMFLFRL